MTAAPKLVLGTTLTLALLFGFLHPLWPEAPLSFRRLHVFLFNLCSGGALILYFAESRDRVTTRVRLFFMLALLYAVGAAAGWYLSSLILSVPLTALVESVRIRRFSLLPRDFFRGRVPVADKFLQASLLCLSLGIVIASLVILNEVCLHLVTFEKLTLDVFFLGYSFPISLVTMSVMFSFMTRGGPAVLLLREVCFWTVNLGVIVFFVFIILELFLLEIIMAAALFLAVGLIFWLFLHTAPGIQQKRFLVSGMAFLLSAALTGILYIVRYFTPILEDDRELLLNFHAMVSLYGWNLSGLFIIIRWEAFPIRLHSAGSILLHWAVVFFLAPMGLYFAPLSLIAMPLYVLLLGIVFLSRGAGAEVRT